MIQKSVSNNLREPNFPDKMSLRTQAQYSENIQKEKRTEHFSKEPSQKILNLVTQTSNSGVQQLSAHPVNEIKSEISSPTVPKDINYKPDWNVAGILKQAQTFQD